MGSKAIIVLFGLTFFLLATVLLVSSEVAAATELTAETTTTTTTTIHDISSKEAEKTNGASVNDMKAFKWKPPKIPGRKRGPSACDFAYCPTCNRNTNPLCKACCS